MIVKCPVYFSFLQFPAIIKGKIKHLQKTELFQAKLIPLKFKKGFSGIQEVEREAPSTRSKRALLCGCKMAP